VNLFYIIFFTGVHPPQCQIDYVFPPGTAWFYNTCFQVHPNCSDPTTPDGDNQFLTFTFAGNWTVGFRQTATIQSAGEHAEFCYNLYGDGVFDVRVLIIILSFSGFFKIYFILFFFFRKQDRFCLYFFDY
jgi:hypothetical protein